MFSRSQFFWILLIGTWMSACTSLPFMATPTPTLPPPTATPTRTPRPTPTSTLTPSPTPVFATYPWKHVWFEYSVSSPPEVTSQFGLTEEPLLVIYTDGLLITTRTKDSKIRSRVLSTNEVCQFIDRLDLLGFFELEPSNPTDETNPIYDFGDNYQAVDEGNTVFLNLDRNTPKSLSFFEPYKKYLARPMRKITEFLDAYNPGWLNIYEPDRLILFVKTGRDASVSERVKAQAWTNDTLNLSDLANVPYTFLEGAQSADVYAQIAKNEAGIFLEDDVEYTVTVRLLYPHEIVNVGSVPLATPTDSLLPVNCNP